MQTCAVVCTEQPTSSKVVDDENFPVLTKLEANACEAKPFSPLPAYHPAKVTEVIEIPNDQRRYQNEDPNAAGKRFDAHKRKCMEIIRETGVEMNMTNSKSNMLTIVLSGHPVKVSQAKRGILAELQQQETVRIHVPHEFHGYLIGRRGDRLRELQAHTMTRISVPPANSTDPDSITVTGSKQGIAEAKRIITETIERQSQQGFERLDIPKIYHPFLLGPNGQLLDNLRQRTLTKINFPPPNIPANIITVSGKREGVLQASEEMRAIYEQVKLYKTIPVRVKRSQHRLVFGPRGSGLADILAQTGVSVELPTDDTSEELILRGRPEDLGRALSMVYERAESSITEEIPASNRFHKLLIGKRGSALAELREGYERVHVEFRDNQDKITVEGPPEEVGVIVERLKARIAELEATVAMDTLRVDPKYFRHIIGRQGATILRLREHKVQIRLPTLERGDNLAADQIVIEGDPVGVEKAKAEIRQLVERLENEKCKDMIIEPRVQQLLCTGYKGAPPPIRTIYDGFPKVSFVWPDFHQSDETVGSVNNDNPSKSVVQLRGDRQQVDAAAERLVKLIKQVIEENYRQEIRLFKEFRPHIFGRGSSRLQRLLDDTKTRIQYPNPSDGSDVFTIIGREENVQQAIKQLEDLQKQLANVKEVIVSIPSALTTKFVGDQAPSLRSICEQCSGVHMRFLNPRQKNPRNTNQVEVVMLGPPDELAKAQKLLDQLNAKVAQLNGQLLDNLRQRTLTKINFPPPNIPANIITVSGKREGVLQASEEMRAIYEQHRLVFGPRGSGLADILAQTGVSVELPTDDTSEELILRGRPEDLGRALSMVYERAESSITEEIPASNRFHKLLIGKRGSALAELREGYERVHVEFRDNQDKITVEGPPEEVGVIVERLKARIAELEATVAMDTLRVDPKYFRHIIGRQGATILRLREHKVQIRLPTLERGDNLAADQIVIEGDPVGVEKAKAEIRQLVERLTQ
ncbi:KH domain protein [Opisthorchis viverrini]|uniref:KH domain protein n=1 Tax=Opisthorchis viverrini TaxID=6198 RepID=A0A1S8WHX2_OPIVI|nr:KH domain protein [Opisthorchis viverrini]